MAWAAGLHAVLSTTGINKDQHYNHDLGRLNEVRAEFTFYTDDVLTAGQQARIHRALLFPLLMPLDCPDHLCGSLQTCRGVSIPPENRFHRLRAKHSATAGQVHGYNTPVIVHGEAKLKNCDMHNQVLHRSTYTRLVTRRQVAKRLRYIHLIKHSPTKSPLSHLLPPRTRRPQLMATLYIHPGPRGSLLGNPDRITPLYVILILDGDPDDLMVCTEYLSTVVPTHMYRSLSYRRAAWRS